MTPLKQLAEQGQSVWIDYLSRNFVNDGDLAGRHPGAIRRHASHFLFDGVCQVLRILPNAMIRQHIQPPLQ